MKLEAVVLNLEVCTFENLENSFYDLRRNIKVMKKEIDDFSVSLIEQL